ncbi:HEAT repeat domain-containing protein [Myxococcus faecalis]|uniref:HEAT repeat domain-containing protein n=1 Tax=Myxococcus faecalis TaxID=3115646 RepID=UPI003CEAA36B
MLLAATALTSFVVHAEEPIVDTRPVRGVLAALSDPDDAVVAQAVATLGGFTILDPKVQAKLDARAREPLLLKWLLSDDAIRAQAALTLFLVARTAATPQAPHLVKLLKDPDAGIRHRAARALSVLGAQAAAQAPHVAELLRHSNPFVREGAARMLARLGSGGLGQSHLVAELLNDPAADIRRVAAIALEEMGPSAAALAPRLAELLSDPSPSVRTAVANALGAMGTDVEAQAPRVARLLGDPDVSVRLAAIAALGKMGAGAVAQAPLVAALLNDSDVSIRMTAASALASMGAGAAVHAPALVGLLTDVDSLARASAVDALVLMVKAGVQIEPRLAELLQSSDAVARRMALKTLGAMGSGTQAHISSIVDLLEDSDGSVRLAAAAALGAMGAGASSQAPRVGNLLRSPNPDFRMAAADALGRMGERAIGQISLVVDHLQDPNGDARIAAAAALGAMGPRAAPYASEVAKLLGDSNVDIRQAAVEALGAMGKGAAQQAHLVAEQLQDPNPIVRSAAVVALGAMGKEAVTHAPHVAWVMLNEAQPSIRRLAALSLANMGEGAAAQTPLVAELLQDSKEEVYETASEVLTRFSPLNHFVIAMIIEASLSNAARSPALLMLAHIAGNGDPDIERVLQWVVRLTNRRPEKISLVDARAALRALGGFWPYAERHQRLADAFANSIETLAELHNGSWKGPEDRELFAQLRERIQDSHPRIAQKLDEVITSKRSWKWVDGAGIVLMHATVWILLIFLYPRSRQVQAVFFWNRRVRQVLGFPYVGLLLTWVPFLRKRLLSPFKRGLTADAALDAFVPDAYFPELEAREPALKTRGRLANLLPHLSGHVVLEGASGLGKSTYLKHLLSKSTRTSVFLRADRCQAGVLEAIQAKLEGYAKDSVFLKSLIFSGALDVYIDGLNEVSADVRARVVQFMEENLQGNILVTTQRIEWTHPSTARLLVLEPLSDSAITGFLKSREPFLDGAAALGGDSYATRCECFVKEALTTAQEGQAGRSLREVLSNPLDLTVVAQMLRNGQTPDLSQLRQQQYELMAREYAEAHLSEFPLGRFAEEAYQMRKASRSTLDEAAFSLELLTLERAKLVLRRQWKRPDGKDQQEWRFRHDKIQEFFVAQTFLDPSKSRELEHMGDPPFRGVYFFLMAYLSLERAQMLCGLLVEHAAETGDHSVSDECVKLLKARARDACMPNPGKVVEFGKRSGAPEEG